MTKKSIRMPIAINNQIKGAQTRLVGEIVKKMEAFDSFVNPTLGLGLGGGNALDRGGFINSVTQNFQWLKLRAMYESNWLARRLIEMEAEDMTREGVQLTGSIEPDQMEKIYAKWAELSIRERLFETIAMARLYGGAIAYIVIEGQDSSTPLDLNTITKDKFLGLSMFDRWQLWPSYDDFDPIDKKPMYYTVLSPYDFDMKFTTPKDFYKLEKYKTEFVMHRSRVIRFDGNFLPYIDFLQNQRWYSSILIDAMDVITSYLTASAALDSAAYKASCRYVKIAAMYEVLNQGTEGQAMKNLLAFVQAMKLTESTENITVLSHEDEIGILNYNLDGLISALDKKEQQLSTVAGAPATKLLGEPAKGMNSSGDNELRIYYDKVKNGQEKNRPDILNLLKIMYISTIGQQPPEDFNFNFTPLWQIDQNQKAIIAQQTTDSVDKAFSSSLVSKETALKELKQSSQTTGVWTNITDEDLKKAKEEDEEPPLPADVVKNILTNAPAKSANEERNGSDSNVAISKVSRA